MNVNIFTLYSKINNFKNNNNYNIKIYSKIGEGGYGVVYKLDSKLNLQDHSLKKIFGLDFLQNLTGTLS